jgi:predicted DsbA family dithiol-disulfide isomerase
MHIDIVSDSVCPWCYIGKRRFERALQDSPDIDITVAWRPYQLNPDMPPEGMDRESYVNTKFGGEDGGREVYERLRLVGETEDIPFAFDLAERMPNTVNSHRLIRWSKGVGVQDAVVEKLFQRYFLEGADISEPEVLTDIAEEVDMDADLVAELLEGDDDCEQIKAENEQYRTMGVTGVPCFIVDNKYVVMGAQESETFLQLFEKILTAEDGEEED